MGMRVTEGIEKGLFSKEVARDLEEVCGCGEPLYISNGLSRVYCKNLECSMRAFGDLRGKQGLELWQLIELLGIPELKGAVEPIFSGYSSLEGAYKDIESGQVPFIARRLGIEKSGGVALAFQVYKYIIVYKQFIERELAEVLEG